MGRTLNIVEGKESVKRKIEAKVEGDNEVCKKRELEDNSTPSIQRSDRR